jgi:uncharacterized membrane protein
MRKLTMSIAVATAVLFLGGQADAATWSRAAAVAAAAKATEQTQTVGCRRPGRCPFGWWWNGWRCRPC